MKSELHRRMEVLADVVEQMRVGITEPTSEGAQEALRDDGLHPDYLARMAAEQGRTFEASVLKFSLLRGKAPDWQIALMTSWIHGVQCGIRLERAWNAQPDDGQCP